ncbi:MAG: RagB/SusD family nutrient uptake outer membrane protein [Zunongwangia sp.]|uniref:RagB/SusD family nutrient uptake outer membrane protein n=1 Tax=Zunongwangia sp. TaxID=1965325 RepID=UPI0032423BE8
MMKKNIILTGIFAAGIFFSCSNDKEFENKEYASREQIEQLAESSPEALLTVTNGISDGSNAFLRSFDTYGNGAHSDFGLKAFDLGLDLMSNDMTQSISHWFSEYYNYSGREQQNLRSTSTIWNFYYKVIRDANLIIELTPDGTEDPGLRATLGKALALRGFCYFQLIRLYADGDTGIPLYTEVESIQSRESTSKIVEQIGQDLNEAYDYLAGYSRTSKTQIDQNVVAGFLARYNLEYGNYQEAIAMAEQAQTAGSIMNTDQIFDGFDDISNPSWIWGADITSETNSGYASFFSQMSSINQGYGGLLGVYKNIDKRLYEDISNSDLRKDWFVGVNSEDYELPAYANVKFVDESGTAFLGDYVYMRVEEMYLIEAEARALNGDDSGASQALFELMSKRDPEYVLSSNIGGDLLEEIRLNRRIELWGEGFAFYDMKRWDNSLDRTYEGTNHPTWGRVSFPAGSSKFVFQIPIGELNANDDISEGDQNPL